MVVTLFWDNSRILVTLDPDGVEENEEIFLALLVGVGRSKLGNAKLSLIIFSINLLALIWVSLVACCKDLILTGANLWLFFSAWVAMAAEGKMPRAEVESTQRRWNEG